MSNQRDEIVILGGGVIGLACAYYLLRAGFAVRVLEAGRVGFGASHGNCGTITPSHAPPLSAPGMLRQALRWMLQADAPLYVRPTLNLRRLAWLWRFARNCNPREFERAGNARAALLNASRQLLAELIAGHELRCGFRESGLVYAYRDAAAFEEAASIAEIAARFGVASEQWGAERLLAEEPALLPGLAGGLHFPGDACLRPDRFVAELARLVREAGGRIEEDCAVLGFERRSDALLAVRTSGGVRHGREFVLACGAWSPELAARLGLRLPLEPGKGYSITYTRPAAAPRRPLLLKERSVCVTAWEDGFRLGSTMEFSGYDARLNARRLRALERSAAEYLQTPVGLERREEWFGWRPMSRDEVPVIGRSGRWRNLLFATGHGMLGLSMCAITGRMIADELAGENSVIDARAYSPQRFGL